MLFFLTILKISYILFQILFIKKVEFLKKNFKKVLNFFQIREIIYFYLT